jgi:hypothetical protein
MYSAFEVIYRGSMLFANLEESPSGKLAQSTAYKDLDPSEKSAVSYFLGLTTAKLLAQRLLGVTWLMHLDVYKHLLRPQIVGGSRPDLVGMDRSCRWIAVEAKGRTHSITRHDKTNAKGQVGQLIRVQNTPVFLGVGVISYFNSGEKLQVFLQDPPFNEEKGSHLDLEMGAFLYDYYRMFVDLIHSDYGDKELFTTNDKEYIAKYINEVDAWVGIDESVYEIVTQSQGNPRILEKLPSVLTEPHGKLTSSSRDYPQQYQVTDEGDDSNTVVGEDGIYIQLGKAWLSRKRKNQQNYH